MTHNKENRAILSFWIFIIILGPCIYGIYYASTKMGGRDTTGWLFLIIILSCILLTLCCTFLSNCGNLVQDCVKCMFSCKREIKENVQIIPNPLVTLVSNEAISVEIIKT